MMGRGIARLRGAAQGMGLILVAAAVSHTVAPSVAGAKILVGTDVRGYVKYVSSVFIENPDSLITDNVMQNRLSFRLYIPASVTLGAELRNRVFYGELVRSTRDFGDLVTRYDGALDLEFLWVDGEALVFNTIVDRLWLDYSGAPFAARAGRQRINWGLNPIWNPNDLFNAFDYLDWDYEERPGSDAVWGEYYTGSMSSVDAAYKWAYDRVDNVGAARFVWNRRGYDLQVLGGRYQRDWAVGAGWAGNLGDAGFKGEGTAFIPSEDAPEGPATVSLTSTVEYAFKGGWSGMSSYLLNTDAVMGEGKVGDFLIFRPSAKNLFPARHTLLCAGSRQFSPIFYFNLAGFYAFQVNWLILFPTCSFSLATNWDLDLVGQLYWGETDSGVFASAGNAWFLQVKWSF